jgi:hypothetical protein
MLLTFLQVLDDTVHDRIADAPLDGILSLRTVGRRPIGLGLGRGTAQPRNEIVGQFALLSLQLGLTLLRGRPNGEGAFEQRIGQCVARCKERTGRRQAPECLAFLNELSGRFDNFRPHALLYIGNGRGEGPFHPHHELVIHLRARKVLIDRIANIGRRYAQCNVPDQ